MVKSRKQLRQGSLYSFAEALMGRRSRFFAWQNKEWQNSQGKILNWQDTPSRERRIKTIQFLDS